MPTETQKEIINLRIHANETGLRIMLKSDVDWTPAFGRNPDFEFLGITCKAFKSNIKDTVKNGSGVAHNVMTNCQQPMLFDGSNINATFLQAKDIATGVTFFLPASGLHPTNFGEKQLHDFKRRMADWATAIYRQLLKETFIKCVVSTTEFTAE